MQILLLFLHGSGGSGNDLFNYIQTVSNHNFYDSLLSKKITMINPTAETKYFHAISEECPIWLDRSAEYEFLGVDDTFEDSSGVFTSMNLLSNYIKNEESRKNIRYDRIIIGGFSNGGGMSLQILGNINSLEQEIKSRIIGYFCISSFLTNTSNVYQNIISNNFISLPLLMMHGINDSLVKYSWGQATYLKLKSLGINVNFKSYNNVDHEITNVMLKDLFEWIDQSLLSHLEEQECNDDYMTLIDHLPYKIRNIPFHQSHEIIFKLPENAGNSANVAECLDLLTGQPILACDSSFIIELHPELDNHVRTIVQSLNPDSTAKEISKRLYYRLRNGSIDNPCQLS